MKFIYLFIKFIIFSLNYLFTTVFTLKKIIEGLKEEHIAPEKSTIFHRYYGSRVQQPYSTLVISQPGCQQALVTINRG